MFYETARTIGPGWHGKSYKPSHYDDSSSSKWSPFSSSSRHFRSPGSSPVLQRKIIHHDLDDDNDSSMFGRRSPTFQRQFFNDNWDDAAKESDEYFGDRLRMFKKNMKPRHWEKDDEDFGDRLRREMDDAEGSRDIPEEGGGRVHHIPIMVERRREMRDEARTRRRSSPPPSSEQCDFPNESEEWPGPQVHRLRKNFEPEFPSFHGIHNRHRVPRADHNLRPRAFTSPIPDWDPQSVHTLPTRKLHKVHIDEKRIPKSVFRSYSETHEDIPREHPAASRSHSDSHCPRTTYVTKISVNMPSEESGQSSHATWNRADPQTPKDDRTPYTCQREKNQQEDTQDGDACNTKEPQETNYEDCKPNSNLDQAKNVVDRNVEKDDEASASSDSETSKGNRSRDLKVSNSLQQIAAVLQNVDDLVQHVQAYCGDGRDKQFRFLDEMLTRCMLRLDDVDTDGLDDVRNARKAAVRQVQACIETLESRAEKMHKKNDKVRGDLIASEDASQSSKEDHIGEINSGDVKPKDAPESTEGEQTRL